MERDGGLLHLERASAPAKVQAVLLDDDGAIKTATVVVPDSPVEPWPSARRGRMPVSPPS